VKIQVSGIKEVRKMIMKFAISVLITLLTVAIAAAQSPASIVTINGEVIPGDKIAAGELLLLEPHERCSPHSDALLRERAVETILLERWLFDHLTENNATSNLEAIARNNNTLADLTRYLETENPQGAERDSILFQIAIYNFSTDYYDIKDAIKPTPAEYEVENQRLIDNAHPLVNTTVGFKVRGIDLFSLEHSKKVAEMFRAGADIEEVREQYMPSVNALRDGKRWIPAMPKDVAPVPDYNGKYWRDHYPEWNADMQIGQVVGPHIRWTDTKMTGNGTLTYTYFVVVDRLETENHTNVEAETRTNEKTAKTKTFSISDLLKKKPESDYRKPGDGLTTISDQRIFRNRWKMRLFEKNKFDALKNKLRESAEVQVNGVTVSSDVAFEGCKGATPASAAYLEALVPH
jgi:hypothetical protein